MSGFGAEGRVVRFSFPDNSFQEYPFKLLGRIE